MLAYLRVSLRTTLVTCAFAGLILSLAGNAHGAFHQWKFNEVFSNADGTIQFIEFSNPTIFSGETLLSFTSMDSNNSPPFDFPNDLSGNTANKKFLVATSGFGAFPDNVAPQPDYIMPNGFFSVTGDTLVFASGLDMLSFGAGALPLDGVMSLNRDLTTGINSPTNFAGITKSIDVSEPAPGDANGDGVVDIFDVNLVSSQWNTAGPEGDVNEDGTVNIFDVNLISANWTLGGGGGAAVPEPTSLALAAAGVCFAILTVVRRRR